jgi:hypothetical protein
VSAAAASYEHVVHVSAVRYSLLLMVPPQPEEVVPGRRYYIVVSEVIACQPINHLHRQEKRLYKCTYPGDTTLEQRYQLMPEGSSSAVHRRHGTIVPPSRCYCYRLWSADSSSCMYSSSVRFAYNRICTHPQTGAPRCAARTLRVIAEPLANDKPALQQHSKSDDCNHYHTP